VDSIERCFKQFTIVEFATASNQNTHPCSSEAEKEKAARTPSGGSHVLDVWSVLLTLPFQATVRASRPEMQIVSDVAVLFE